MTRTWFRKIKPSQKKKVKKSLPEWNGGLFQLLPQSFCHSFCILYVEKWKWWILGAVTLCKGLRQAPLAGPSSVPGTLWATGIMVAPHHFPASGTLSFLLFLSHSSVSFSKKYIFSKCMRPAPVLKNLIIERMCPAAIHPNRVPHVALNIQSGWFRAPYIKLHFMGLISTSWVAPL